MQDNFISQSRARGQNKPHILDLVLTDDAIIDDIEYPSLLGKVDHAVRLFLTCKFASAVQLQESTTTTTEK